MGLHQPASQPNRRKQASKMKLNPHTDLTWVFVQIHLHLLDFQLQPIGFVHWAEPMLPWHVQKSRMPHSLDNVRSYNVVPITSAWSPPAFVERIRLAPQSHQNQASGRFETFVWHPHLLHLARIGRQAFWIHTCYRLPKQCIGWFSVYIIFLYYILILYSLWLGFAGSEDKKHTQTTWITWNLNQ